MPRGRLVLLCARVACACTRATPGPTYIQYFPAFRFALSLFPHRNRIFVLRSAALPCALMPSLYRPACYNHWCHTDLPFTVALTFRQPPSSSLSLVSFFFFLNFVSAPILFFLFISFFFHWYLRIFHVGEYGLCHIYLTEVGTAISFSALSCSLATSYLFAVPGRRKSKRNDREVNKRKTLSLVAN